MTIERRKGKVFIVCDTCGEEKQGTDFHETWGEAKREGWRVRKFGDDWVHGCSKTECEPA